MATPVINSLDDFPDGLTLSNGRSSTFGSGATVTSAAAGTVRMRFELPPGWMFDNGTREQSTTAAITAGETKSITMSWRATSTIAGSTAVALTVIVSLQGDPGQQQRTHVMSVASPAVESAFVASTPILNQVENFPDEVILFPSGTTRRTAAFTSGANVTAITGGEVVLHFAAPAGYTFGDGSSQQETSRTFAAGETDSMLMGWRLSTARENDTTVAVTVTVTMRAGGGSQSRTAVMAVSIATARQRFMQRMREMFQ